MMQKSSKISLLAVLLGTIAFSSIPMVSKVMASDLDQASQAEPGHVLKMSLNKSIVIKLPEDAQDVVVGNREIVDAVVRSRNTAYLFARELGQTNVFFFNSQGEQIMNINIDVAIETDTIKRLLQTSYPGNSITVDTVNNNIVLGGTVSNIVESAEVEKMVQGFTPKGKVINTIKIADSDQVMLKVRIIEVQRDALKLLGVDTNTLLKTGKFALDFTNITTAIPRVLDGGNFDAKYDSDHVKGETFIKAMENASLLKTLAEPNLTAISGQPAKFRAGGQIPYETCDEPTSTGYIKCTVLFKDVGIELAFTPVVLSGGRINLTIKTSVSNVSPVKYRGLPAIDLRSAETVVELPSGGSMMLAGLIKDTTRQIIEGYPGLKTLPVLGALFRSRDYVSNQTELVVIVTPYLVGAVNEKELATPADGLNNATDLQTILFGQLNKVYGTNGHKPEGVYHGNIGFVYE